jgi:hypothetical protein
MAAIVLWLSCIAPLAAAGSIAHGSDVAAVLSASGVAEDRVERYAERLDELTREFSSLDDPAARARDRAAMLHAFLHERVLCGKYLASASDLGVALDGGSFNCAAATALFLSLADRAGLDAVAVSVKGHVWPRVRDGGTAIDIESTCRDWFAIAARYRGVATEKVSPAMAAHRRRVAEGRELSTDQFLAIFHYNRGVTLIRAGRFAAAAAANRQALALDPHCRPAAENLEFAREQAGISE